MHRFVLKAQSRVCTLVAMPLCLCRSKQDKHVHATDEITAVAIMRAVFSCLFFFSCLLYTSVAYCIKCCLHKHLRMSSNPTGMCAAVQGDVLFVRFFEGPASGIDRQGPAPSNPRERLQKNAEALIDVPIIMQTMKVAIQKAVAQNK